MHTQPSTAETNKAFIMRYLDALNGKPKPAALLDQYIADSDQALKGHIAATEMAFPRYRLDLDDIFADGDAVVVRVRLCATHEGNFMGMPATGAKVEVPGVIIYRIDDGKIVDHWMLTDKMAMMQQLNAVPVAS